MSNLQTEAYEENKKEFLEEETIGVRQIGLVALYNKESWDKLIICALCENPTANPKETVMGMICEDCTKDLDKHNPKDSWCGCWNCMAKVDDAVEESRELYG